MNYRTYQKCIDACLHCAAICNHCATSCLEEEHVHMMTECIRLDMQCSVVCFAAAQLMSLESNSIAGVCGICAVICDACADECEKHDSDHCIECANACRNCANECKKMQ